jgi:hypothetical protein
MKYNYFINYKLLEQVTSPVACYNSTNANYTLI